MEYLLCSGVYLSLPSIVGSSVMVCTRVATVGVEGTCEVADGVRGERQGIVELPIADRLSSISEVREVGDGAVGALSLVAPTSLL